MTVQRLTIMGILLLFAAFALVACSDDGDDAAPTPTAAAAAAFAFSVQQSDGQQLDIVETPARIVSLSPHATEIICAIDAGDQLAAVEQYANCPAGSSEKTQLDAFEPSLEAIAGQAPDLVYLPNDTDGIVQALRDIGITVLFLNLPASIEGVLEQILVFGDLVDREDEAAELVESLRARIDDIEETVADIAEGPRIFHELDPTYFTVSPDSFIGDFYNLLKAQNIASGASGEYPQLSAEVIVDRDPEVIILADEAAGVTIESVAERPGWSTLAAVQTGRVCLVDPNIVSRPGPFAVDGLEELAACIYPELFPSE